MNKLTEQNLLKKSRFLKYSLLASISVGAVMAMPVEGMEMSKEAFRTELSKRLSIRLPQSNENRDTTSTSQQIGTVIVPEPERNTYTSSEIREMEISKQSKAFNSSNPLKDIPIEDHYKKVAYSKSDVGKARKVRPPTRRKTFVGTEKVEQNQNTYTPEPTEQTPQKPEIMITESSPTVSPASNGFVTAPNTPNTTLTSPEHYTTAPGTPSTPATPYQPTPDSKPNDNLGAKTPPNTNSKAVRRLLFSSSEPQQTVQPSTQAKPPVPPKPLLSSAEVAKKMVDNILRVNEKLGSKLADVESTIKNTQGKKNKKPLQQLQKQIVSSQKKTKALKLEVAEIGIKIKALDEENKSLASCNKKTGGVKNKRELDKDSVKLKENNKKIDELQQKLTNKNNEANRLSEEIDISVNKVVLIKPQVKAPVTEMPPAGSFLNQQQQLEVLTQQQKVNADRQAEVDKKRAEANKVKRNSAESKELVSEREGVQLERNQQHIAVEITKKQQQAEDKQRTEREKKRKEENHQKEKARDIVRIREDIAKKMQQISNANTTSNRLQELELKVVAIEDKKQRKEAQKQLSKIKKQEKDIKATADEAQKILNDAKKEASRTKLKKLQEQMDNHVAMVTNDKIEENIKKLEGLALTPSTTSSAVTISNQSLTAKPTMQLSDKFQRTLPEDEDGYLEPIKVQQQPHTVMLSNQEVAYPKSMDSGFKSLEGQNLSSAYDFEQLSASWDAAYNQRMNTKAENVPQETLTEESTYSVSSKKKQGNIIKRAVSKVGSILQTNDAENRKRKRVEETYHAESSKRKRDGETSKQRTVDKEEGFGQGLGNGHHKELILSVDSKFIEKAAQLISDLDVKRREILQTTSPSQQKSLNLALQGIENDYQEAIEVYQGLQQALIHKPEDIKAHNAKAEKKLDAIKSRADKHFNNIETDADVGFNQDWGNVHTQTAQSDSVLKMQQALLEKRSKEGSNPNFTTYLDPQPGEEGLKSIDSGLGSLPIGASVIPQYVEELNNLASFSSLNQIQQEKSQIITNMLLSETSALSDDEFRAVANEVHPKIRPILTYNRQKEKEAKLVEAEAAHSQAVQNAIKTPNSTQAKEAVENAAKLFGQHNNSFKLTQDLRDEHRKKYYEMPKKVTDSINSLDLAVLAESQQLKEPRSKSLEALDLAGSVSSQLKQAEYKSVLSPSSSVNSLLSNEDVSLGSLTSPINDYINQLQHANASNIYTLSRTFANETKKLSVDEFKNALEQIQTLPTENVNIVLSTLRKAQENHVKEVTAIYHQSVEQTKQNPSNQMKAQEAVVAARFNQETSKHEIINSFKPLHTNLVNPRLVRSSSVADLSSLFSGAKPNLSRSSSVSNVSSLLSTPSSSAESLNNLSSVWDDKGDMYKSVGSPNSLLSDVESNPSSSFSASSIDILSNPNVMGKLKSEHEKIVNDYKAKELELDTLNHDDPKFKKLMLEVFEMSKEKIWLEGEIKHLDTESKPKVTESKPVFSRSASVSSLNIFASNEDLSWDNTGDIGVGHRYGAEDSCPTPDQSSSKIANSSDKNSSETKLALLRTYQMAVIVKRQELEQLPSTSSGAAQIVQQIEVLREEEELVSKVLSRAEKDPLAFDQAFSFEEINKELKKYDAEIPISLDPQYNSDEDIAILVSSLDEEVEKFNCEMDKISASDGKSESTLPAGNEEQEDTEVTESGIQKAGDKGLLALPVSSNECALALSDGREKECLALGDGSEDEESYDSGFEEEEEIIEQLSDSDGGNLKITEVDTSIPLEQKAKKEMQTQISENAPTLNQAKVVNTIVNNMIRNRLDASMNMSNNMVAVGAGDEEESRIKRGLWMRGMYGTNNHGHVENMTGYRGTNKGATIGFDVEIDNNILGIAYSNVHSVFKFKNSKKNDKELIDSHVVSIYGQKELPRNFALQALVSASKNFIKDKTTYSYGDTKIRSNVKHRNHSYNAEALLNYNYLLQNKLVITPNIGLRYGKSRDGVYNETGINVQEIALTMKENNILSGIVGTKVKVPLKDVLKFNNLGLTFQGAVEHNFKEKTQRINRVVKIFDTEFKQNYAIPKQPKTSYNLGTGIIGSIKNTTISLDYNYYLNKHYRSHQGSVKLKVNL